MSEYNKITIVNDHDEVIGSLPLLEAIKQGAFRRVVRVFVVNQSGQYLIQKRGSEVFTPCRLDFSVAGHVDEGESYEVAAKRELAEELGLVEQTLVEITSSFLSGKYFAGVFKLPVPDGQEFAVNNDEVSSLHWYYPEEIDTLLERSVADFTPEFVELWQQLRAKILAA